MRRTNYLIALIALTASLLFAGSALAHGSSGHGRHAAVDARAEAALAVAVAEEATPAWAPAVHSRHETAHTCPEAEGECCTNHCCASGGLQIHAPELERVFASQKNATPADRPPSDATPEAQLRPPCR